VAAAHVDRVRRPEVLELDADGAPAGCDIRRRRVGATRREPARPHRPGRPETVLSTRRLTMPLVPRPITIAATASLCAWALAAPAQAQTVTLTAQLHGGEENPAIVTGAHGRATVTINRATGRIDYTIDIYNLPTGIVGAHIHVGSRGVNGPIIFNFTVPAVGQSNDFALSGSLTAGDLVARAAQGINSFEDAIFAIASGVTYVNIHTQANPGGEMRGQLCPENANGNKFNGVAVCTAR
jgi:hypothetical protein